jgi:hypothetical protein
MFSEHDRSEGIEFGEQIEQAQLDANDAARRRVLEYDESLLDCEHADNSAAEAVALDRSARTMEGWDQTKDPVLREKLLDSVGREMMHVHEAPPAPIYQKDMPNNELGAYSDRNFETNMNDRLLRNDDPTDALETYLHEYRHIEQNYEAQKSRGTFYHDVNPERAAAVGYNLEPIHYIDGRQDMDAYQKQLVETDAERFGTTTAKEILERREELRQSELRGASFGSDADHIALERLTAERRDRP